MIFISFPPEALVCAKTARYTALGESAVNMVRLVVNQVLYKFTARTDGAFYLRAEGSNAYGLWLIAPDNSINFASLESMAVHDALEYLATYCDTHDIPSWIDFAEWLSTSTTSEMAEIVFSAVRSITVSGHTTTDIPQWSDPHGNVSVFFRWCKDGMVAAETEAGVTLQMADYKDSASKYTIPFGLTVQTKDGLESVTMNLIFQI